MDKCRKNVLIGGAVIFIVSLLIVAIYIEWEAIGDLSTEQRNEVIVLQEKLLRLQKGDFVERGEKLYQFIELDTSNSVFAVHHRIFLVDNAGNEVSWHLTNPYSAVENWREIKRILKRGEPGWDRTDIWFHHGDMPF